MANSLLGVQRIPSHVPFLKAAELGRQLAEAVTAKAAAIRPELVGNALQLICKDAETSDAMFTILETQKLLDCKTRLTLIPHKSGLLTDLLAAKEGPATA